MHRLIYSSRAVSTTDREDLRQILVVSRKRNAQAAVTGHLLYSGVAFLQVLEGDEAAVQATFSRIAADPRHTDLRLLVDESAPAQTFGTWSMGFAFLDQVDGSQGLTSEIGDALVGRDAAEQLLQGSVATQGRSEP